MASQNGNTETASLLLKANANPNLHRDDGVTPLYTASPNRNTKVNANPNLYRDDGLTPLSMTSQNEHTDIVSLLANPNLRRDDGVTHLFS